MKSKTPKTEAAWAASVFGLYSSLNHTLNHLMATTARLLASFVSWITPVESITAIMN